MTANPLVTRLENATEGSRECPFDSGKCDVAPDVPRPVCGDLWTFDVDDGGSNCFALLRAVADHG